MIKIVGVTEARDSKPEAVIIPYNEYVRSQEQAQSSLLKSWREF